MCEDRRTQSIRKTQSNRRYLRRSKYLLFTLFGEGNTNLGSSTQEVVTDFYSRSVGVELRDVIDFSLVTVTSS